MRVVLSNSGGLYGGTYRDKFDHERPKMVEDVGLAAIFELTVSDGRIEVTPALPDGDWNLVPVRVSVSVG